MPVYLIITPEEPEPIRPGTLGFSPETRKLIDRAVELDPALETAILAIADSAYADGADSES
jgi:hypothetical protein